MKANIRQVGKTVLGQSIDCWSINSESFKERILVLGGVHGDEKEGIEIANGLLRNLLLEKNLSFAFEIIPCLNKDGETLSLRSNYNDVDLNRNVPTKNWVDSYTNPRYKPGPSASSEPETKALFDVIHYFKPTIIISLHSFSESLLLYNPGNGKHDTKVRELSEQLGIKLVDKMPYEVVGSLNTYAKENSITTLTVEAPRDESWNTKKDLFINSLTSFVLGN